MDIFALLLQNLEKSLAADKKQKSGAVHPDLFEDLLQKSLERTFSQKIAPKAQPTLSPTTSERSKRVFSQSQTTPSSMPIRDAQDLQKLDKHQPKVSQKGASMRTARLAHPKSEAKEMHPHPFMVNIPAQSHPVQKDAHTDEVMRGSKTPDTQLRDKASPQERLPKSSKKSRIAHPPSQNADSLTQFVAIAPERPAQPAPLHPKSHEKRVQTATTHTESARNDAPHTPKSPSTRIKNHRPHDVAPALRRSSVKSEGHETLQSVQPPREQKSESTSLRASRHDVSQPQEIKQPQSPQSATPRTNMPQTLEKPIERSAKSAKQAKPTETGYTAQHTSQSGEAARAQQYAAFGRHDEPAFQTPQRNDQTGRVSTQRRPHHARYIDKNVTLAKSHVGDAPRRHASLEQPQPLVVLHDAPKEVPLHDEGSVTQLQPKRIAETQEQPQNMAQQQAHSFDSGESFEAHQAEASAHVMDEHAFEQLRRHEVRTIQLRLDQTLINVTMHQRQLSLNFVSSHSMQLDGNIAEVVDAIMQESGYERYKVTLRDRVRRITIDSKGREAARSEARSGVNVKV